MKMRNITMILTLLIVIMAFGITARGESYSASTMRLLKYNGDVVIEDAEGNPRFVMENVRFASGEAMKTGKGASASVNLDSTKIVTLDEQSRVEFALNGNHMELNLTEGVLFLDVSEKLDENESLDIKTSTMTVGIRGTIVFVANLPAGDPRLGALGIDSDFANGGHVSCLGVLEGTAQLSYQDENRNTFVSAGQIAVIGDNQAEWDSTDPKSADMTVDNLSPFVIQQIAAEEEVTQRILEACPQLFEDYPYTADGDWEYTGKVMIIAQSASKLYDGNPLTRTGDILVYGLPEEFGITAYAGGSRTDAGESENPIASYTITNLLGEDITAHFPEVETVAGRLVVDPAPMTIWTGSATKAYDGTPLTNEEAGFDLISGNWKEEPWRNTSLVLSEAEGETLYGVSGSILVHGTNPLTGETRQIVLLAGQKLTVHLKNEAQEDSIDFKIENVPEEEIPQEVLRLYADNPELLSQACEDAGWDEETVARMIEELPETAEQTTEKDGLTVSVSTAGGLRRQLTNARINIDSDITDYNGRALSGEEANFTEIRIDDSVKVTATGSQTEVGQSENTYEIDWGTENPNNFIISEELGTLKVIEPLESVTITAGSVIRIYDGKPLRMKESVITGLPDGYSIEATIIGSRTDVGVQKTEVESYRVYDPSGEDVTEYYPNLNLVDGTITIKPAPLTVRTGSAEKVYDGTELTNEEASIAGLVNGETAAVTASGTLTDAGSADNGYEIAWGSAKSKNYTITEELGTLTIEPLALQISMGETNPTYSGSMYVPNPVFSYGNGAHAGENVYGTRLRSMEIVYRYSLFTGDSLEFTVTGSGSDAGSYTLATGVSFSGSASNFILPEITEYAIEIQPALLTIQSGSASKPYDGLTLTNEKVTVTGLKGGDSVSAVATGEIKNVGSAVNEFTVDWGDVNSANYALTEEKGTLTVTVNSAPVTITARSAEKIYDGEALVEHETDVSGLPSEELWAYGVTEASITNVGEIDNAIVSYVIGDAEENDVSAYFSNVILVDGKLTVTPASVLVTTVSAEKVYDGTALTAEASITGLAAVDKDKVTVKATGTITDAGEVDNTCSIDWGNADPNNYVLTQETGTLKVTPLPVAIDIQDTSVQFNNSYNFAEVQISCAKACSGSYAGDKYYHVHIEDGGINALFQIDLNETAKRKNAGTTELTGFLQQFMYGGEGNFSVTVSGGSITVTPVPLTVTTGSASKVYDGTPLTNSTATVTGMTCGEGIKVTATGTVTSAGSATNTYEIDWRGWEPGNYTITESLGTLTVEQLNLNFRIGEISMVYTTGTNVPKVDVTLTIGNGPHAGETVAHNARQYNTSSGAIVAQVNFYTLFTGDRISFRVTGMGQAVGSYTLTGSMGGVSGYSTDFLSLNASSSPGSWTVEPLKLSVDCNGAEYWFDNEYHYFTLTMKYANGSHSGESVSLTKSENGHWWEAVYSGTLFTGDSISMTVRDRADYTGMFSAIQSVSFTSGNAANYSFTYTNTTMTIKQIAITVTVAGYSVGYDGSLHYPNITAAYTNGPKAGQALPKIGESTSDGKITVKFNTYWDYALTVHANGVGPEKGTYNMSGIEYSIVGDSSDTVITVSSSAITIN